MILIVWNRESLLIKQMQYSPLQTEKDRVSEWESFRYAVFLLQGNAVIFVKSI